MQEIWNANPDLKKLYCFEDGNCFAKLSDAMAYKKTTQQEFTMVEKTPKQTESEEPQNNSKQPKKK